MVQVRVVDGFQQDYAKSICRVERTFLQNFGIQEGEVVELLNGERRIGVVLRSIEEQNSGKESTSLLGRFLGRKSTDAQTDIPEVRVNGFVRASLNVGLGQIIRLDRTKPVVAQKINIVPLDQEDRSRIYMEHLTGRPLIRGQIFEVENRLGRDVKAAVVRTTPPGIVLITEETEAFVEHETPAELLEDSSDEVSWDDIGGCEEVITRLRTLVELPLRYPEVFGSLAVSPPQGVLLTGPSGVGKTFIARAAAFESGVTRFFVQATEMVKGWWEVEEEMDNFFDHILSYEPAVVVLDEVHLLAPAPSVTLSDMEKRMTQQLIQILDRLRGRRVVIIGTTTDTNSLHPSLRIFGRFEVEIPLAVPNQEEREAILRVLTRGIPLLNVDLKAVSKMTGGFTPADLELLVREAGMFAIERVHLFRFEEEREEPNRLTVKNPAKAPLQLTQKDFVNASKSVQPSASRELISHVPRVSWDDIGGLEETKRSLREMVEWPISHPAVFDEMGVRAPRGVLLYGPPGTGKTLLAKAIANEIQANFITVKGPELLSKWFAESARMIRDLFKRARQIAPTIVFFDEIDAIVPIRGGSFGTGSSQERDRIINQMLASLDGVEAMQGVFVVGATNRPEAIDPALLRPGRLDRLIYVPVPDVATRLKILRVHTRAMKLAEDVDIDAVARETLNFTGADLENLCREAVFSSLRRDRGGRTVSHVDFDEAVSFCRSSVTPEIMAHYQKLALDLRKFSTQNVPSHPEEYS